MAPAFVARELSELENAVHLQCGVLRDFIPLQFYAFL